MDNVSCKNYPESPPFPLFSCGPWWSGRVRQVRKSIETTYSVVSSSLECKLHVIIEKELYANFNLLMCSLEASVLSHELGEFAIPVVTFFYHEAFSAKRTDDQWVLSLLALEVVKGKLKTLHKLSKN